MVSECQNSESEENFFKNLHPIAKQLEALKRAREFKIEFENEKPNFPFIKQDLVKEKLPNESEQSEIVNENEDLKMQVYEDKDYDIEEIKFWNFVSKNKGIKPNVIRTIVYKVPESSYIVRKIPIVVEDLDETPKPPKVSQKETIDQKEEKSEPKNNTKVDKSVQNNQPRLITSSRKNPNEPKFNVPVKFDSEDIIVIDEDDDIIGIEENENEDDKQFITRSDDIDKEMAVIEDDDIIEENFIEKTDSIKKNELETKQEKMEADDKITLLQNSFNIQKKQRRGRPASRPKVVIEKADEPASTISIKKSLGSDTKSLIKSKNISNDLNKSLPIISQPKSMTRKSLNLIRKQDISDSLDPVSSSSSNISTI